MLNIIVCFKWVVDELYIRRTARGELDFSNVDYKISDYDRNAIEEAVRLRDVHGGRILGVTVASTDIGKGVKDALSRGLDEVFVVVDERLTGIDPHVTASIIARVINSRMSPFDLILCGEGSSDVYAQQVGPRVAELLNIPCATSVSSLKFYDGKIYVDVRTEEGLEEWEVECPSLVTVLPEINTPRIPGVKDTLLASKKPFVRLSLDDLNLQEEAPLRTLHMVGAPIERVCEKFGTKDEDINRFIDALKRKGVL
ncbi:MAG: electron transfer flavoprotein subunit beta/FixA family protein [Syntrophales bacterium]|nr:electron transfer flavoprotein subunit beta/FixA family protein [Syntrophales bacterium]